VISPDLIGREDELARLGEVLAENEAAVVIISGPTGVGRHALIDGACRQAPKWKLMPPTGLGVYVEPRTTADGFAQRLRIAIGAPPVVVPETADGSDGALPSLSDAQQVAATLTGLAPLVLILERYRPQRGMDRWLADALMPALRDANAAIVLAILDPPEDVTRLTAITAEHIELGALAPDAVRPEIVEATRSVHPPLTDSELEVYVQGIAERPGVFDSLLRLLAVPVGENSADATATTTRG
jgi:hypothetical protein